jgi:hypothetical protein
MLFRPKFAAFILTALLSLRFSDSAIAQVQGPPVPPPPRVAVLFDSLRNRFTSEQSGYGCYPVTGVQNGFNCVLDMPCSISIISVQNNAARGFGMNFGGRFFVNDPQCNQSSFLVQIEAMLEMLFSIPKSRAQEIIVTMDRDPKKFERCIPGGELPEGIGGLSYGPDDSYLKIFCWFASKQ